MANKNIACGFKPKGELTRANKYISNGAIYPGDVVKLETNGEVVVASAGDAVVGIALGYASATGQDIYVADDPGQLFIGQVAAGEVAALTNLNGNANHVASTASTRYKCSRQTIDGSSIATNSNLTLKLLALDGTIGEDFGSYAKVVCIINNHQLKGGTGTVGT